MKQSKQLYDFYVAIQAWIDSGFKDNPYNFSLSYGICLQIDCFLNNRDLVGDLDDELSKQFTNLNLSDTIPFNHSWDNYLYEQHKFIMYNNPLRLQWIKDRIAEGYEGDNNVNNL